jgi:hypothetical protein
MGGYGSGRRRGYFNKPLVEDCLSIDVRILMRSGCLKPGLRYSGEWQNGCNIVIETKLDAIELFYDIEQPYETVHIKTPLTWTLCNFGGRRPWFICPGCGRRVARLYLESRYFLCRYCNNLAYSSQREDRQMREFSRQMNTRLPFTTTKATSQAIYPTSQLGRSRI